MAKITRKSKANSIIKIEEMNEEEDNTAIQNRILIEQCLQCDGSLICCSGCKLTEKELEVLMGWPWFI